MGGGRMMSPSLLGSTQLAQIWLLLRETLLMERKRWKRTFEFRVAAPGGPKIVLLVVKLSRD